MCDAMVATAGSLELGWSLKWLRLENKELWEQVLNLNIHTCAHVQQP